MKLSILTTITNPKERQDPFHEAFECYKDLADELVIVDGSRTKKTEVLSSRMKVVYLKWPDEWSWDDLPKHLNAGLKECTGDWVIKLDIDQFIHENVIGELRWRLSQLNKPVATMQKMSVYWGRKYVEKGEMVICINKKKFSDDIIFGEPSDANTDLCKPIWKSNRKLVKDIGRTGIAYWNFDYTFKTKEVAKKEFARFARAYTRYFGNGKLGNTEDESWEVFKKMMGSRMSQHWYKILDFSILPKYIRKKYYNITPEQFGHSAWGEI